MSALAPCWTCTWTALVMCWHCSVVVLVLHWHCPGATLVQHWYLIATAMVLHWPCPSPVLVMQGYCNGNVLAMRWYSTSAVHTDTVFLPRSLCQGRGPRGECRYGCSQARGPRPGSPPHGRSRCWGTYLWRGPHSRWTSPNASSSFLTKPRAACAYASMLASSASFGTSMCPVLVGKSYELFPRSGA